MVNGKAGISPEMAIRLTKAFGSTEETWLRMQLAFDLAQARKSESKSKSATIARKNIVRCKEEAPVMQRVEEP